jgi:hypothetical protein
VSQSSSSSSQLARHTRDTPLGASPHACLSPMASHVELAPHAAVLSHSIVHTPHAHSAPPPQSSAVEHVCSQCDCPSFVCPFEP